MSVKISEDLRTDYGFTKGKQGLWKSVKEDLSEVYSLKSMLKYSREITGLAVKAEGDRPLRYDL